MMYILLLTLLFTYTSATQYWLYAGAGGCDSDDPSCKQPPPIDTSTIYILSFDSTTGSIALTSKLTGFSPDWLRVHPSKQYLLAVDNSGGVTSLKVNAATGELAKVGSVRTPGGTVFMDLDPSGTRLFVASYGQGTIGTCAMGADGVLGTISSSLQFYGHGPNKNRQEAPHPHSINVDPKSDGRFVFIPDLGLDTVFSFEVVAGKFQNTSFTSVTQLPPGAGPRHMAFHPTLPIAYVLSEMASTITTFTLDTSRGHLIMPSLQTIKTLPSNFTGFNKAAEVVIHPSGKWLFASNRGYTSPSNSIIVYSIAADSGLLTQSNSYSSGGTFPRGVVLAPEGDILIVGGQDTNNVVTMKFDPNTGSLTPTGSHVNIATPITFAFVPQA